MKSMKLIFKFLLLSLALLVAINCGAFDDDDKSTDAASTDMVSLTGTVDFAEGLSKARMASGDGVLDAGEVQLENISSGEKTDVSYSGNTFSAEVSPGDYIVVAKNSAGSTLRKIVADVSASKTNAGTVDLDSSTVAELIEIIQIERSKESTSLNDLSDLAAVVDTYESAVLNAEENLGNSELAEEDREVALMALGVKEIMEMAIEGGTDISSDDYQVTETQVSIGIYYVTQEDAQELPQETLDLIDQKISDQLAELLDNIEGYEDLNTLIEAEVDLQDLDVIAEELITEVADVLEEEVAIAVEETVKATVAVIPTSEAYTVGNFTLIDENFESQTNLKSYESSDLAICAYEDNFYVIGKYSADYVEKFHIDAPSESIYHYSVMDANDSEVSVNPHAMIFASKTKAYLTRYDSATQWIVNPNASTEEDFKIGSIDLSAYNVAGDAASGPNFSQGVIVGNKLFLAAQRLDAYWSGQEAYVAVIDVSTDEEIDTGMSAQGSDLKGILLPARNPEEMFYDETTGKIYIQCAGKFAYSAWGVAGIYNGGIVTIDPDTYETTLLTDDGEDSNPTYNGNFYDLAISSANVGAVLIYNDADTIDLRSYNPSTGVVGDILGSDFESKNIDSIACDDQGYFWVNIENKMHIMNSSYEVTSGNIDLGLSGSGSPAFVEKTINIDSE
ncbi:MAG: hypothetical protein HQL32_05870 [Planctomycetes bacterium]|nr:hypothetical protein [Planctomycetota bacterium]